MKKSVIALAVATAAMPFAAQADTTLTGSATAKYFITTNDVAKNRADKALDVDSDLDITSTEVLANGMTATAAVDVNAGDKVNGKVGLSGDFGSVTAGSGLDSDAAFQSGDVGAVIDNATNADSTSASTTNAINYTGGFADLKIQVQLNAATDATGTSIASAAQTATTAAVSSTLETYSTQVGVTYEMMDGLTIGLADITDDPDRDDAVGLNAKANVIGVKYEVDNIMVSYGKEKDLDGIVNAKYTMDELSAAVTYNPNNTEGKSKVVLDYAGASNGLSATWTYNQNKTGTNDKSKLVAGYKTGDLSFSATRQHDKSNDFGVAYNMGNAVVNLDRDGSKAQSTIKYKVSF